MNTYRITTKVAGVPIHFGRWTPDLTVHYVMACNFTYATTQAGTLAGITHEVISVTLSRPQIQPATTEIVIAIDQALQDENLSADDFGGYESTDGIDYLEWVERVAQALRVAELTPDVQLNIITDSEHLIDYTNLSVFGPDNVYRSIGSESEQLTEDSSAIGMAGLLAIAERIIDKANEIR